MNRRVASDSFANKIDNCTFVKTILMLLVILYHSCVFWKGEWFSVQEIQLKAEPLGVFSLWLNSFHVYTFTMVSGYIFSYQKWEKKKYKDFGLFVVNKAKRLIVPYIFVSIAWVIPFGKLFYNYNLLTVIRNYVFAISPSQLWFLMMLFWCFIGAWVLSDAIEKSNISSFAIAMGSFGIGIICGIICPNIFCLWTAFQYFPMFILGMKLRSWKWIERIPIWVYTVADIVLFMNWIFLHGKESAIMKLMSIGVEFFLHIVGALMVWSVLQLIGSRVNWKDNKAFIVLSHFSMPMYLFHQQIIYLTIFGLNGKVNPYLHAGINFFVSLVCSFIISSVLMKWKATRILVGER